MTVKNYMSHQNHLIQVNESKVIVIHLNNGSIEAIAPSDFKDSFETFDIVQKDFDTMFQIFRARFRFDEERFPMIFTESKYRAKEAV